MVKVDLHIPRARQQNFIDYLNAALRGRISSYTGSAGINNDGLFESTVTGPFSFEQGSVSLIWRLVKDRDGNLLYVIAESIDTETNENIWEKSVYEFICSVLATTLSETYKKYFRRSIYYYIGTQLDGEYWLPKYRFAPVYPTDPAPHLINAERVVSIDQEITAIDDMHAFALSEEASRRHTARLTLLLNTALYTAETVQRWVIPNIESQPPTESVRYQLGFIHPSMNIIQMPKKGEICPLGAYKGNLNAKYRVFGELLSLPPEARKILRNIDNADPLISNAFDCGARLYQVAAICGRNFPSVGLAYRVAAVEAVCQADGNHKSFSDFMRYYITSQNNIDSILDYLYRTVRSSHFHAGEFPLGEFKRHNYFDPLLDIESSQLDTLHRICYELTREAIVNWIIKLIPDDKSIANGDGNL